MLLITPDYPGTNNSTLGRDLGSVYVCMYVHTSLLCKVCTSSCQCGELDGDMQRNTSRPWLGNDRFASRDNGRERLTAHEDMELCPESLPGCMSLPSLSQSLLASPSELNAPIPSSFSFWETLCALSLPARRAVEGLEAIAQS